MNPARRNLLIAASGLSLGLGLAVYYRQHSRPAHLLDLELPDVDGNLRRGAEWLGRVVVVNHWATWCRPCLAEIPMLIAYQSQAAGRGVQVVGIAHDVLPAVRRFGDEYGLEYPSLLALASADELLQAHGNAQGALPFTAVFDRDGRLAESWLGALHWAQLENLVAPLL